MSIGRTILGIGGLGATSLGALLGLSISKKNEKYRVKMNRFRTTSQKVNKFFSSAGTGKRELPDPEHKSWSKKFDYYNSHNWNDDKHLERTFPPEVRENAESMRDYCFEKIEGDVEKLSGTEWSSQRSTIWEYCLETESGIKSLLNGTYSK